MIDKQAAGKGELVDVEQGDVAEQDIVVDCKGGLVIAKGDENAGPEEPRGSSLGKGGSTSHNFSPMPVRFCDEISFFVLLLFFAVCFPFTMPSRKTSAMIVVRLLMACVSLSMSASATWDPRKLVEVVTRVENPVEVEPAGHHRRAAEDAQTH